jgi:hypothetical protein
LNLMKTFVLTVVAVLGLAFSGSALAADPTTFGGATIDGGVAKLVSDTSVASTPNDDFSGISLPLPAGLTLAQVTHLSAEFNVTDDDCAGGSPRFAINYGAGKNLHVYLGPSPSFTGCAKDTWTASGNLVGTADACRVDTSQLAPGTQCTTWAAALALVGNQPITSISLIVDSSWSPVFTDKEQTVLVRNVTLNGETFLVPKAEKAKLNPAKLCKEQLTAAGSRSAFNELWSVSGTSNGFGKCVSSVAKARNAGGTQAQILAAIASCKAKGLKGSALGACVATRDGVAATLTEKAEKAQAEKAKGKAKGRK